MTLLLLKFLERNLSSLLPASRNPCTPWVAGAHSNLQLPLHMALFSVCLCPILSFQSLTLGFTWIQNDFIFTRLHLQDPISNQVTFMGAMG